MITKEIKEQIIKEYQLKYEALRRKGEPHEEI